MKVRTLPGYSKHHVPPRKPDRFARTIVVDDRHHRAYHLLFGNPQSFEDACKILKRDWWTLPIIKKEPIDESIEPSDFIAWDI